MGEQPAPLKPERPPRRKLVAKPAPQPWEVAAFEPSVATALQSLVRGDCPSHLQQRAINFIIYELCGTYDPAFRQGGPDGQRATDFALGKAFVGQQIVGILKVRLKPEGEQG